MAQLTVMVEYRLRVSSEELALIGRGLRGELRPDEREKARALQEQFIRERAGAHEQMSIEADRHLANLEDRKAASAKPAPAKLTDIAGENK